MDGLRTAFNYTIGKKDLNHVKNSYTDGNIFLIPSIIVKMNIFLERC